MNHLLTGELGCGSVNDVRFDEKIDVLPLPHVTYNESFVSMPKYGDNWFCLLKSSASLEHITPSDQQRAIKEWHRILCPFGIVIIQTPDKAYWELRLNDPDGHTREWASIQMRGGEKDEYDKHLGLLDVEGLQKLFEENGFQTLYIRDGNQAAGSMDAAFMVVGK